MPQALDEDVQKGVVGACAIAQGHIQAGRERRISPAAALEGCQAKAGACTRSHDVAQLAPPSELVMQAERPDS